MRGGVRAGWRWVAWRVGWRGGGGDAHDAFDPVGGRRRACGVGRETHEEGERQGQDDEVEEGDAAEKEDGAGGGVAVDDAAFLGEETRGHELPELVDDPRAGDDQPRLEGQGDGGEERFLRLEGVENFGQVVARATRM